MVSHPSDPPPPGQDMADRVAIQTFARLDKTALGTAIGGTSALVVLLATLILVVKGGDVVGPNLALLAQFFVGYSVTLAGGFIGAAYGFGFGFALGWVAAGLRNVLVAIYLRLIRASAELKAVQSFMDDM